MTTGRWRHVRLASAALAIAATCASCAQDPVTLKQAKYVDEPTTTTTSEAPVSTTAYVLIPYFPDETTTTAAPRPSTTRAPRTTAAPRPTSSRAPRSTTTAGPPAPPRSLRIRVEMILGGSWSGKAGARCGPSASVHPELLNATATIRDADGNEMSSGVIYAGNLMMPAGGSALVCDMTLHLSSLPYGPSYSMTIGTQPPVTQTSAQLQANGGVFVLTVA